MEVHPEKGPGRYKWVNNVAGNTTFVDKSQVVGTLEKGCELYVTLDSGLPRAVFVMFLLTEVHPFMDGNGRLARASMNSELISAGETPIIIVNSFREDYMGNLRKLSRDGEPAAYVRMLIRAQQMVGKVGWSDFDSGLRSLQAVDAFAEPGDGRISIPESM